MTEGLEVEMSGGLVAKAEISGETENRKRVSVDASTGSLIFRGEDRSSVASEKELEVFRVWLFLLNV